MMPFTLPPPLAAWQRRVDMLPGMSLVVCLVLALWGLYWWHSTAIESAHLKVQQAALDSANLACKTAETERQKALIKHTTVTLARGQTVAQVAQKKAQSLDAFFNKLERQADAAKNQNPDAAECSLSPERLRIWQAANAGGDRGAGGASASESDGQTSPATPAPERPAAGARSESPRGGEGVSPAGEPLLPAAGVFAGARLR